MLGVIIIQSAVLVPLVKDAYLQVAYAQTLARWLSKVRHPDTVFVGDSITAGGGFFNDWRDINLASNGLQLYQIAAAVDGAGKLSPGRIAVMAGTNDAFEGPIDIAEQTRLWQHICSDSRVVVTLPPPTRIDDINARLSLIRPVVRSQCAARPMIEIADVADSTGKLRADMTEDGVHPTKPYYSRWRAALRTLAI